MYKPFLSFEKRFFNEYLTLMQWFLKFLAVFLKKLCTDEIIF